MATIPSINRMARILPAGKDGKAAQHWQPLCTKAGVLVNATRRSLVADVLASLMDAHMASNPLATFGAVEGGIRAVSDGTGGAGAPFFIETRGASVGEVYIFGGLSKRDGLLGAIGQDNYTATRDEAKGGLYITLSPTADVAHVYGVLALHQSTRANVGWLSSMGAPAACEQVTEVDAPAPVEAKADDKGASAKDDSASKAKRGRKAKADKPAVDAA